MDDLIFDPDKLDLFAVWIEQYCKKQREVFHEYIHKIQNLAEEWDDERTYGGILEQLKTIGKNFDEEIEQVQVLYPRQYRNIAIEERNRPK